LRSRDLNPGQGNFEIEVGLDGAADEQVEFWIMQGLPPIS
jgi:hypothetical protein